MGEAKAKSRKLANLVRSEARCIYCANPPTQIEHMPPKAMFRAKSRPKGMEFASCAECNNGTSAADLAAAFFARLSMHGSFDHWTTQEARDHLNALERKAPGVRDEVFADNRGERKWIRSPGGILQERIQTRANGPLTQAYLTTFAAKLAMALYREHIGQPIPLDGRIEVKWYLNAGLAETEAHAILSILPIGATLEQGTWSVPEQFAYRYNTDHQEIVAALVGFHANFHVFVMATSNPIYEGREQWDSYVLRPGTLREMMPRREPLLLLPGQLRASGK